MPAGTDRPIYLRAIKPLDTSGGFFYAFCLACVGAALARQCKARSNRLLHCADPT
ncbi:MAG: hypothetical protein ACN6P8_05580 [Achromobacter piechaudii]